MGLAWQAYVSVAHNPLKKPYTVSEWLCKADGTNQIAEICDNSPQQKLELTDIATI